MSNRLAGRVALITGGTSGIGAATAQLFIKEGAQVVITGRSVAKGQALAETLGQNAAYHEADITQEAAIRDSIDFAIKTHGRLDVLFNNAGGPVGAPLDKLTQDHIDYGVRLLLSSAILGTKYAVEPMKGERRRLHHQQFQYCRLTLPPGRLAVLGAESCVDPLHPHGGHRAGRAQYPRELDLSGSHRHANFLGWFRARKHPER